MVALHEWFQPLLWVLGTITAIIGFIRLCKPIWDLLETPKKLNNSLLKLNNEITNHFKTIDERLNELDLCMQSCKVQNDLSIEGQINLLRDRLSQGYNYHSERGKISEDAYRSLCEIYAIYKKLGGNSYAANLMGKIDEIYKQSHSNS